MQSSQLDDGFNQNNQDNLDTPEKHSSQQSIDGFIISYRVLKKFVLDAFNGNGNNNIDQINGITVGNKKQYNSKSSTNANSINNWETITVSKKLSGYTLRNLRCGTNYRLRVEAFNEMGSGEASDILEFSTLGRGNDLIVLN